MRFTVLESGLGSIVLFARDVHLWRLDLVREGTHEARRRVRAEFPDAREDRHIFEVSTHLLARYLKGERVAFPVPVDLYGCTPFTRRVLEETRKIPYGRLASYGTIAGRLGMGDAARAVGQALGRNPIPLVIPCHRVIRHDGSIGGFGLGLDTKRALLSIEGVDLLELRQSMALS